MTPAAAAAHFRRAAAAVRPAVIAEEQQAVQQAKAKAVALSSGPHSTAHLRAAGHPYSRRRPDASYDAAIVNFQTGSLRSAWQAALPAVSGDSVVGGVVNRDRAAKYMSGTKRMIERPVAAAVQRPLRLPRLKRLKSAVRRIFLF